VAKFCYQPFEDLVVKAKVVTNQTERTKLYEKAQVIFKEQAPWFTIAHAVQLKPCARKSLTSSSARLAATTSMAWT
jgi:dipeptide transport system substrate-binding protein